jgi:hypothetical protein
VVVGFCVPNALMDGGTECFRGGRFNLDGICGFLLLLKMRRVNHSCLLTTDLYLRC